MYANGRMKQKKKWSETKTLDFVCEYRANACLWDVNHLDYKNRKTREVVYFKMAEEFDCSPDAIRRKIKSMRGAYCQERNKIKDSIECSYNVEDVYVPSVLWYDEMDAVMNGGLETENPIATPTHKIEFTDEEHQHDGYDHEEAMKLRKHCRYKSKNDNSEDDEMLGVTPMEYLGKVHKRRSKSEKSSNLDSEHHKVSRKLTSRQKNDLTFDLYMAIEKLQNTSRSDVQEDEFDIFGRSVAQQLRSFRDIKTALTLQHKLQGLLSEERIREMGNVQQDCCSSSNSQPQQNQSIDNLLHSESSDKNNTEVGPSELIMPVENDSGKLFT